MKTTFSNNRLKTTLHTKNGSILCFKQTRLDLFQVQYRNKVFEGHKPLRSYSTLTIKNIKYAQKGGTKSTILFIFDKQGEITPEKYKDK